jgi:predicted MFS family arabinose efflux permease
MNPLDNRKLSPQGHISTPVVLALLPFALGYFMSYLLRAVNQVIAPDLIAEFRLSQGDLGQMTAAYLFAFVLFQLPLGILLDRFGPRRVQIGLLSIAALGVGLFALATDVWQLTAARGIIGLGLSGSLMACFKATALWLPQSRIALGNSAAVAIGALGFAMATEPADWLARQIGWRAMFGCLVGAMTIVVALIFFVAPSGGANSTKAGWRALIGAQRMILTDRKFWRLVPMVAAISGSYIAVQSLWAGRWLVDVNELSREDAARTLLWMAGSFALGSLSTGFLADVAQRKGISLAFVIGATFLVFALAQVLIVSRLPISPLLCWILFGCSGQGANLAYATLAVHFGKELSGRAQSMANMVLFIGATAFQWGIGIVLDYFPASEPGRSAPVGYQVAFIAVLAVQIAAFVWFALDPAPDRKDRHDATGLG